MTSTAAERQARANALKAEMAQMQAPPTNLELLEQACEDALADTTSAGVQRLLANITRITLDDNPDKRMQMWAKQWLSSTQNLVKGATSIVLAKHARANPPPVPPLPE